MPDLLARPPSQPNPLIVITLRRSTAIGIGVSLLVHLLLLFITITQKQFVPGSSGAQNAVVAHLRPRPGAQLTQPVAPVVQPDAQSLPPEPAPRRPREILRPPVVARREQTPRSVPSVPPPLPPLAPRPSDNNSQPDMMQMVAAKRAEREQLNEVLDSGGPTAPVQTEEQRRDAIIAQNLQQKKPGVSGVFRITSMGQREGAFEFRGWTTNERLSKTTTITVDAGLGGNVELAIVRGMIKRIRVDYIETDFNFESQRLNKVVRLSSRVKDNAFLEEFLHREFFGTPR